MCGGAWCGGWFRFVSFRFVSFRFVSSIIHANAAHLFFRLCLCLRLRLHHVVTWAQNALDWASKPLLDGEPPMKGKPVAVVSVGGGLGGLRAQLAFRQTAIFMQLQVMTAPEVGVRRWGGDFFDENGDLKDNDGANRERGKVQSLLEAFVQFASKLV